MKPQSTQQDKSALRGEPSYVWRAGQQRRFDMIQLWGGEQLRGKVLENGCGVGQYLQRLAKIANLAIGIDIEFSRLLEAKKDNRLLICAAGEHLPFDRGCFDVILSNEVIEHVQDDQQAMAEMARTLLIGGKMIVFCPNRGYPFETHGIYWRGKYCFGNIPLVNYLPKKWRNRLAPHVRVYTHQSLLNLLSRLPFEILHRTVIFGGYDNILQQKPCFGKILRTLMGFLEKTPLRIMGLSHFLIARRVESKE